MSEETFGYGNKILRALKLLLSVIINSSICGNKILNCTQFLLPVCLKLPDFLIVTLAIQYTYISLLSKPFVLQIFNFMIQLSSHPKINIQLFYTLVSPYLIRI